MFVRWMDSMAGPSIRRHTDLAALFVAEIIHPEVIRTEDELTRARRDCFLKQPPSAPSPSGWSNPDPRILASVVARLSEKTLGKKSKQILTHPTAAQLLAILDSTPNGSLASEQTVASSPFEALWLELESSARILTLNLNEIEMLVKLSLSLSAKLGGLTDILRCVSMWQRIKSLYGSMSLSSGSGGLRIPHLLHALNRFSLDVLNAIWSRVNEQETTLGVHAFGTQFRHMLLARPEIKLASSSSEGAAAADPNAVGISAAISFLLAHVGLLAETHLFFSRFNHLRLPVSAHTPQAAAAPPQANAKVSSLSIPLVLDARAAGFSALVESLEECLSVRHNERVSALLSSHSLMHIAPIATSLPPGLVASPSSASSSSSASSTQRSASPVMMSSGSARSMFNASSSSAAAASAATSSAPPAAVSATVSALLTPAAISSPDHLKSLKLLLRLLCNIAASPSQEKFRRIKSSHPSFQGLIGRFPERMAVLRSVGFEEERKTAANAAAGGSDVPASASLSRLASGGSNVFSVPISPPPAVSGDTQMDPASSPTPPMLLSYPSASPSQSLPMTSFTLQPSSAASSPSDASPSTLLASSMSAHTPSSSMHHTPPSELDEFIFLPSTNLDLEQLQATINLLQSTLNHLQSLNAQVASTLVDKHKLFTTLPSPSSAGAASVLGAVAPPFPFLPHSLSPVHPQASQQDFSHILSLLRLFFYASRTWHIDPQAWSATAAPKSGSKQLAFQPLLLRSGVSAWRKLVEMLLALLETPQLDGALLFGSGAAAASAPASSVISSSVPLDADQEQHRAEKDRVVAVLLEAFPCMPTSCQVSVVQAALRDDVLRTGLANLVQENPGCFHLLPHRSAPGPFLSVWERILASRALPPSSLAVATPPDQSVLSLMGDAQLVHNLIAQFEGGMLIVPSSNSASGPSKLHAFWSSAARKLQEHLLKTQNLSSMSALLATAQAHPNAASKLANESANTSVYPSPILSPQSASSMMGLPLPSLSLGPRQISDPASSTAAASSATSASPVGSPSAASSSSSTLQAPHPREASLWPRSIHSPVPIHASPLATPTTKATAAAPLVYPAPVLPASASSSAGASSRASPLLSPFPSPSPSGSPFSPSPSDWIAGSKAGNVSPGSNMDDVDLASYTGILEGLLSGLQSPESLSSMSVASAKAQSSIRFQFGLLFRALLQSWLTRIQCPITSYDVLLAPSLLKQAVSMLICAATKASEQASKSAANTEDPVERMDESELHGVAASPKPTTPIERSLRTNPIFSLLAPTLLHFSALLDQLPHMTLDPLFLSQLYSLHASIGGFDAWSASREDDSMLKPFVRAPLAGAPTRLEYRDYFKCTLPSDAVLDFIRAPSEGGESELLRVLKVMPAVPSSTLNCATKLAALGATSVIPSNLLPLPALIRDAVERHVFGVSPVSASTQLLFPSVAQGRLHHSALLSCQLCGCVHSDAESLFHHSEAAQGSSLCASEKARNSVLRHSVLWTIATVSRSLASAHPSSDLLGAGNLTASQMDVRVQPDGTPVKPDVSAVASDGDSLGRAQAIPKTTAQWLKSDLVKAGLESAYLELSAADSSDPLSQQLPFSSGGAADESHVSGSDLTASAKLFPFFHSLPASVNASNANSPSRSHRTLSAEINASMADEKLTDASHMSDELKKDLGRSTSGSLSQSRKSVTSVSVESHEKVNLSSSGIQMSRTDIRSPECPAKESSTGSPGVLAKEEESAEMVDSPMTVSVHAVRIPPSAVTPLPQIPSSGLRSKESQDQLRKSLTITTPTHNNSVGDKMLDAAVTPTGPPARGDGKATPSFATPNPSVLLPASFTSFPPSPNADTYPHASFLSHLIFGDGDARLLDDALMSHVTMRVHATQRKMVGESGVRASRAILAALLKHTGKVELAVEYNKQQMARKNNATGERASGTAAAALKPPPSLLKLWKLSSDLLSDLITLHQNGLHNYCLSPGCDQTVLEESSVHGSYRCGNGHVSSGCLAKESVRYEQLADRVMQSAELLLKLKPAYTAQDSAANPSTMLAKMQAARVRKLLRVKPLNVPFSPSGLIDPSSPLPPPDLSAGGPLKRSGSSTLSTWSPSPRTPLASSPPPSFPAASGGLPPLHRPGSTNQTPQTPASVSLSRGHSDSHGPTEGGASLVSPRTFPSAVQLVPFDDESKRTGTGSPSLPAAASANSSARKIRDSMRRELAQRRWQELRAELLASRMPSLLRAAAPPISSLVMAFCRNLSIDSSLRAQQMERQIRAAVVLAEHRTRGLESMAYLLRHAPSHYKALAIVQWNACIHAWQNPNASGSSSSASVLERALHAEGSFGTLAALLPPLLIPHRYDFLLHAVGPSLLTQVQEAFYIGLGANLGLMHRCMHVLGLHAPEQDFSLAEEPMHTQPFTALRAIARLRRAQSSSEQLNKSARSSPLFGPMLYTSSFNSSFASLTLDPSESLSFLLLALNSWFVSYASCAQDYAFLHTAQVLALLQQLCFHFPEVDSDVEEAHSATRSRTGSAESNSSRSAATSTASRVSDVDRRRCLAVGRQGRRLFRLLAMSALTQQQAFNAVVEEESNAHEAAKQEAEMEAAGQGGLGDSVGLQPDSFEASILHALFTRLDFLLQHRLSSSRASSQLHSFEHPQDERDCFEAISILLLACAALHIKLALTQQAHEGQEATAGTEQELTASCAPLSIRCFHLLSQLLHPSIFPKLSMRCQRRSIGLCNLLLPMVTPTTIEMLWNEQTETEARGTTQAEDMADAEMAARATDAAATAAPSSPCSESSQLVSYLLLSIGYYSCGKFVEPPVTPFPHSHARCSQLVSELLSLVRNLHNSKCWLLAVSAALSDALSKLKHAPLDLRDQSTLDAFYSAYAATLVYGGYIEPLRIGGRVLIHRVSSRAEKLAQRESSGVSATGSDDARGTIVGFETHHAIVIRDGDDTQRLHVLPVGALEPLPRYPCTQPFHLYGQQGLQNLIAIVRFINGAFHNTAPGSCPTTDTNAGFALFPTQSPSTDTQPSDSSSNSSSVLFAQYMHAQLKLHAMRALLHCISLTLTRPELVAHSVQQYTAATAVSSASVPSPPPINSIDVLVQCILKETGESIEHQAGGGSSSSRPAPALPFMSHLLSLSQQVIPLSSSLGKLDDLCSKMQELHALMHERADERAGGSLSMPSALSRGVHADLLSRGMQLFSNDAVAAANWAKRKQQEHRAMHEESKQATSRLNSTHLQPLLDLGFDDALCKRALLLHNGDATQSLHWLKEHGANEVASLRRGVIQEPWGLEGVDFYQESGHWAPRVLVAADAAEEPTADRSSSSASSSNRKSGGREEMKELLSSKLDSSQSSLLRSSRSSHGLPHAAPPMDPYRRLALYTAPQMAVQAFRNELVHHQLTGRPLTNATASPVKRPFSRGTDAVPCAGWSLEASDVRAGVGQRLRISRSWVAQQQSVGRRSDGAAVSPPAFRWYFLTEDNHWAPLDAKDMLKLDACYASGTSFCWIGVEEKAPSLIRLDKMCMYSEITGHGRPLRRKIIEANPMAPPLVEEHKQAAAASSTATAPQSLLLFDSLSADRQSLAEGLSMMGFSREWCALALTHTQFHAERAADWLLTEANIAKCEAHERTIAVQQAEMDKRAIDAAASEAAVAAAAAADDDMKDDHPPLTPEESDQVSKKKQKLNHLLGPGLAAGWSLAGPSAALLASEEVDLDTVYEFSGQLGTVLALSRNFTSSTSAAALQQSNGACAAKVLMEWSNEELNCLTRGWVPIACLEWDLEQFARVHADYTRMHETAFRGAISTHPPVGSRKLTHTMQQQISTAEQTAAESGSKDDSSSSSVATVAPSNTLFNLAVDVSTSAFIVYSRRIVLLLLYLLSLPPKPSTVPTSPADSAVTSATLGWPLYSLQAVGSVHGSPLELIANLTAGAFVKILKLASVDTQASFSACSGNGGMEGMAAVALTLPIEVSRSAMALTCENAGHSEQTIAQDGAEMMPSTPGLVPRNRLDVDYSQPLSAATAGSPSSSAVLPPHPSSIDLWLVLSTVLHNAGPLFSSPSREQLFALLLDDVKRTLHSGSYFVRDIDTEHPYQSAVTEIAQEIHIENAAALLVTFDRRCNINQSHACLAFYSDRACTDELAVFSGSADEFSHIVVPGSRFYYSFRSGSVRSKPYEFGHRFRVRPLGFSLTSEADAFNVVGPALATAINLGVVPQQLQQQQQAAIGGDNASVLHGAPPPPAHAFAFSLGWPLLVLLSDSPSLADTLLSHSLAMDLLQSMLRYLTVCRSPCKVLVTRALTSLCVRVRNPLSAGLFEILLRVMEQLYESNTASGWGSSPFLCALVDLIRQRPTQFKLSDADLWSIDSVDNRPASWFFLTVLRAESLSKALLHSSRLPHVRVFERAMHDLSDVEVLRWCLKQPELCLKLHKQVRGWNNSRREWMQNINGFSTMAQAAAVLIHLRDSLLPECFRLVSWTAAGGFLASKEWEARLKLSGSVSHIAGAYMDLEAALKWGDQFPEAERAFGDTWASRRGDWLAAMRGLALGHAVKVASPAEAMDARWTRAMDESLVSHLDDLTSKSARRLMSLTFRDIEPLTPEQLSSGVDAATGIHPLRNVPVEQLRARFAVLKLLSTDYMRVLPVADLSFSAVSWTLGSVIKPTSKSLIFQQSKMYLWRSMLGRLYSEERPQFVILNRHEAARARTNHSSRLQHSLFYQLYSTVGLLSDPSSLRRRGQSWMVKFVGEGGHDAGGMYNESLVEICNELQSEMPQEAQGAATAGSNLGTTAAAAVPSQLLLPLFRLCPNGHHVIGEHRASFLPNPCATSPLCLSMFEFVGRLCGICCLDNNRALPLTLASLVWKAMVSEPLTMVELKRIDHHAWNLVNLMRAKPSSSSSASSADGSGTEVTEETFEYLFPDLTFSVEVAADSLSAGGSRSGSKRVIDLIPNGRHIAVTYANRVSYAMRLERFYLRRYNAQLEMMIRGMAEIVPIDFISSQIHTRTSERECSPQGCRLMLCCLVCVVVFSAPQLEILLTGSPSIDVSLLRSKTEYRGNLSARDKHIVMFWEVMEELKQEQRAAFLQFVW